MNCQQCYTENSNEAFYCKSCGIKLNTNTTDTSNTKFSDTLLIIYISFFAFTTLSQLLIQTLSQNWYEGNTKYLLGFIWILHNLSAILIPISIKNKTIKLFGIIITTLLIIYGIAGNISFISS